VAGIEGSIAELVTLARKQQRIEARKSKRRAAKR
jgi:hypothetical protein